jgi:hypothetical protein
LTNLLPFCAGMERSKGFDIRRASKWQTFLDNLRKKSSCPCPAILQVGPHL